MLQPTYEIKSIDSAKFMAISLEIFVDNLTEGIHKIECKSCYCFLEYGSVNPSMPGGKKKVTHT